MLQTRGSTTREDLLVAHSKKNILEWEKVREKALHASSDFWLGEEENLVIGKKFRNFFNQVIGGAKAAVTALSRYVSLVFSGTVHTCSGGSHTYKP
jgi:hypothetical protein